MATAGPSNRPQFLSEDEANLNDSVWELYSPNQVPEMDIIFFHGLQVDNFQDAFWQAWLAKDNETVWPKDWLSKKLPNARILSVTYNSSAKQAAGQNDMYQLGENLVQDIILDTDYDIGQNCPVFLVGHCLGGIVIKEFVLSAIKKKNMMNPNKDQRKIQRVSNFLENFKGAFFYATPNGGSEEITKFANRLKDKSPVLQLLKVLDKGTARINSEFQAQRQIWNAGTFAVVENLPTTTSDFNAIIVVEGSARQDVDDYYTHPAADHFTVCRARNAKDATVINKLTQFITEKVSVMTINRAEHASLTR